jgi:hypothetical protein
MHRFTHSTFSVVYEKYKGGGGGGGDDDDDDNDVYVSFSVR